MKMIVGLGNYGYKYEKNRHNIGFMIIDEFAAKLNSVINKSKFNALYNKVSYECEDIILLKPQTFMNLSGQSVVPAKQFFQIETKDILVLHDELDLKFNEFKYKQGGGFAGHNGLKSIGQMLNENIFDRLRFGIGRPEGNMDVADYVLTNFSAYEEKVLFDETIPKIVDTLLFYVKNSINDTMNKYNIVKKEPKKKVEKTEEQKTEEIKTEPIL